MITQSFYKFRDALIIDKEQTNKLDNSSKSYNEIVYGLPRIIREKASISELFYINGTMGKGLISEIPMVCVFDKEITKSAQVGFYIVYLFQADLSGFYLSLNQGWTQYEKTFGGKMGKKEIRENVKIAQNLLNTSSSFSFEPINLLAKKSNTLSPGYELGNICSKYYSFDKLPNDNSLIDDLRNMLGVYGELKSLVGSNILDIKLILKDEEFQEISQNGRKKDLPIGPVPRRETKLLKEYKNKWHRDYNIAFTALENANFKCEYNSLHETFISAKTKHQFVEAHHLIPMEFQDEFMNSLDVPENIISLCPNCHSGFHFAESNYRNKIIKLFFEKRDNLLQERGLNINIETLLKYYKTLDSQILSI